MTDTIIVQINPTNEHRKLKLGKKTATASERNISEILTTESTTSIARSEGSTPVNISSNPSARGNIVNVNLLIAVNIINQVRPDISKPEFSD
mmetsp:Transcript_20467/g.48078  ORF Transcript_20467/g.48078 Transcript_20467/m.48078 type:complete len:92 (+) Transcript_20467:278-553(+)